MAMPQADPPPVLVPADPSGRQPETVVTAARLIDNASLTAFMEATGDENPIHVLDDVARSIGLSGRVVHGKLVQCVAVDLLRREEAERSPGLLPIILEESWAFKSPVFPDEEVRVRYPRKGNLRHKRCAYFELEVLVSRDNHEIIVQTGTIKALVTTFPIQ